MKVNTKKSVLKLIANRILIVLIFGLIFLIFQKLILRYLGFRNKISTADYINDPDDTKRNVRILTHYEDKTFGVDVSEYQDDIDWRNVGYANRFPLHFVFIRATVGCDRVDKKFKTNWNQAQKKFICGAYHYYRPNENSIAQANLFIENVTLKKGDLPPVLDIEKLPKNQSIENLKIGLRRWLEKIESHYGVRPIIYSGDKYYTDFLEEEFNDYTFWIAHYDYFEEEIDEDWAFWQFTEKAKVQGIKTRVDLNIYNGDLNDLEKLIIQ